MARKERRPCDEAYWYAYVGVGKNLAKKYLGRTAELTRARLEEATTLLLLETIREYGLECLERWRRSASRTPSISWHAPRSIGEACQT